MPMTKAFLLYDREETAMDTLAFPSKRWGAGTLAGGNAPRIICAHSAGNGRSSTATTSFRRSTILATQGEDPTVDRTIAFRARSLSGIPFGAEMATPRRSGRSRNTRNACNGPRCSLDETRGRHPQLPSVPPKQCSSELRSEVEFDRALTKNSHEAFGRGRAVSPAKT